MTGADLIELMLHTGFRISDATLFDMSRLRGNEIMIRAQKNGNHVFAWIADSVRDPLLARAKLHGNRPFIVGRSERLGNGHERLAPPHHVCLRRSGRIGSTANSSPIQAYVRPDAA